MAYESHFDGKKLYLKIWSGLVFKERGSIYYLELGVSCYVLIWSEPGFDIVGADDSTCDVYLYPDSSPDDLSVLLCFLCSLTPVKGGNAFAK